MKWGGRLGMLIVTGWFQPWDGNNFGMYVVRSF